MIRRRRIQNFTLEFSQVMLPVKSLCNLSPSHNIVKRCMKKIFYYLIIKLQVTSAFKKGKCSIDINIMCYTTLVEKNCLWPKTCFKTNLRHFPSFTFYDHTSDLRHKSAILNQNKPLELSPLCCPFR